MRSISFLSISARSIAILAALTPIVAVVLPSPFLMWRRSSVPVRSMIHSCEVSIIDIKSSLVTTFSGTYMPIPIIFELYIKLIALDAI